MCLGGMLWQALSLRETYNNTTRIQSPCFLNSRHTTIEHVSAEQEKIDSNIYVSFAEM